MAKIAPFQSNQKDEAENLRNEAVDLYLAGEKPASIARRLSRSRTWFYQTLDRYQREGRAGLANRSRAPKQVHNKTPADVEAAIVRIRKAIISGEDPELRYAHIGADFIISELERIGLRPPSQPTINRILRRHGLTRPRRRKGEKQPLPVDYPWPCGRRPNQIHLFDFVMRLTGGQRFYGCHLLDQARRWPFLEIITRKTAAVVCDFLVAAWQEVGLPQALYIDNDVVWRGSGSGQRTFSRIVRLCLAVGVEVIFTPPYTPKANPIIESFNSTWDDNFWQRRHFCNLTHVQEELPLFEEYCRHRRPIRAFDNKTADQQFSTFVPTLLAADFCLHRQQSLPLTGGSLHFIRFVASDGSFKLLNELWHLDAEQWAGKTIRATVDTTAQQLSVYHRTDSRERPRLVTCMAYPLLEDVVPLSSQFQRERQQLWPDSDSFDC